MGDLRVPLDWSDAERAPVQPANLVLVQGMGDEVILSFGHAVPPIALVTMSSAEIDEHLKTNPLKVQQAARFALPVGVASLLARSLQENLLARGVRVDEQETTQ